ncbi:MAG TPA: hypothetical protein ENI94_13150 [Gammaproteobacteria bacterium]|nr:hypothetical protein [Gammaproteobacteria bacterium]
MMEQTSNAYYLSGLSGRLRFTALGRKELAPYFAMAGIDIRTIKTVPEYQRAREMASPYFTAWLERRTVEWGDSYQFKLLKAATLGRAEDIEQALNQLDHQLGGEDGIV